MPVPEVSPETIARLKKSATALSVAVGVTMLGIKVGAWFMTGSVSVLTSLIDAILDNAMGLINFFAIRQALRPADREHRFGHGKFEPLASLAQSTFIFGAAAMVIFEAVDRLYNPQTVTNTELGMGAMVLVIVMMVGLVLYQQRVVRLTGSLVVRADYLHYRADIMMHASIIVSLLISGVLGIAWVDAVFALAIAAFLLWGAKDIFIESFNILSDHEFPDEERHRIRDLALSHPQVHDVHDLRTRSSGEKAFIQLHIEMDPDINLTMAHQFTEEVIDKILAVYPDAEVQIHEEPVGAPRHRSWCRRAGLPPPKFAGEYGGLVPEDPPEQQKKESP